MADQFSRKTSVVTSPPVGITSGPCFQPGSASLVSPPLLCGLPLEQVSLTTQTLTEAPGAFLQQQRLAATCEAKRRDRALRPASRDCRRTSSMPKRPRQGETSNLRQFLKKKQKERRKKRMGHKSQPSHGHVSPGAAPSEASADSLASSAASRA